MDLGMVEGGSFQKRCDLVYEELQRYCRQTGLDLHMTGLTKTLLGCATAAEFPTAFLSYEHNTIVVWTPILFKNSYTKICCNHVFISQVLVQRR